ncbi:MAG TPA: nuclear transport factor 2 family protein [Terriglobales bacterium]|nr:nuclear transport factor 2 family protein [Terriglobales bacterium]
MESKRIIGLSVCAMVLLWTFPAISEASDAAHSNTASLQQQLIDLQKALVNAQERGDAEYVRNAVADDFTEIETNGNTTDKSDLVRDVHPSGQAKPAAILYEFEVLPLDENCAVVTYKAVFPDKQLEKYQHVSDTWVKEDGRWKLKFQQSTLNLWSAHDLD